MLVMQNTEIIRTAYGLHKSLVGGTDVILQVYFIGNFVGVGIASVLSPIREACCQKGISQMPLAWCTHLKDPYQYKYTLSVQRNQPIAGIPLPNGLVGDFNSDVSGCKSILLYCSRLWVLVHLLVHHSTHILF